MEKNNLEDRLVEKMLVLAKDPLSWVKFSFDWGHADLADYEGPDDWQTDVLSQMRDCLQSGGSQQEAIQIAIASGHGIGKSALVSWVILWSLSTKVDTKGVVTANTENQLKTKTWAELAKWHRLCIVKHWFKFNATSIHSIDDDHVQTWRIDMIPWSERNTEAFAGLHNKGKRILIVFDEASAIPDPIWEVTEGALTDKDTEIIWLAFGNPTRNDGRFHACFNRFKHRWYNKHIDSRTAKMTDKEQIKKWVEDYGEDSDFVRVRVRGVFPKSSDRQFIGSDLVEMARGKHLRLDEYNFAAKVLTVDPAWTGGDETTIGLRQGNSFSIVATYPRNDNDFQMAGYIAKFEDEHNVDAVFIDFGYGTGIASAGKTMGRDWVLIPFGGASSNPMFKNKRAEMWGAMKDWLKAGGAIPDDPVLCQEITGPEYIVLATGSDAGKIVLESKEDMKKRGLSSPNRADVLALSFAYPVQPKVNSLGQRRGQTSTVKDYDPFG